MAAPLATFKDLCVDAVDVSAALGFWSAALGLRPDPERECLVGADDRQRVWINAVPEPHEVKNRVHFDVHAGSVDELTGRGARLLRPAGADRSWTVLTDPDGQEFCAFVREQPPDYRLYELVVDAADPAAIARWWAGVLGGRAEPDGTDWGLSEVPGMPFEYLVFGAVPEPKTVKNRVHWDVTGEVGPLLAAGATLLREPGEDRDWTVLADPEGNEFCVFTG